MSFRDAAYGFNAWLEDFPTTEFVILAGAGLAIATGAVVLTKIAKGEPVDHVVLGVFCGLVTTLIGGGVAHDYMEPDPPAPGAPPHPAEPARPAFLPKEGSDG